MAHVDVVAIDLPHHYYTAIGEFLCRFAQIEYQLHEVIWRAMAIGNKEGRIMTIGTDVKVLCSMVLTITSAPYWVKKKNLSQEMDSIAGEVRKLYPFRNCLAHGSWQHPPENKMNVRLHFMKEKDERILPRIRKGLDDSEIREKAKKLRGLNVRAAILIAALESELTPAQRKVA